MYNNEKWKLSSYFSTSPKSVALEAYKTLKTYGLARNFRYYFCFSSYT